MRQSENGRIENCQSLYVRVMNRPVTTQYADSENGVDYGMESSIVITRPSKIYRPDREIEKLRGGANLKNILDNKGHVKNRKYNKKFKFFSFLLIRGFCFLNDCILCFCSSFFFISKFFFYS